MQEIDDTHIEKVQKKERYDQHTTSMRPLVIFHFTVRVAVRPSSSFIATSFAESVILVDISLIIRTPELFLCDSQYQIGRAHV